METIEERFMPHVSLFNKGKWTIIVKLDDWKKAIEIYHELEKAFPAKIKPVKPAFLLK